MTLIWSVILLSIFEVIEPASIEFLEGNIIQAREIAEESGKMVLIEVYASWCASCRLMEETTFRSPQVVEKVAADFIAVRLDVNGLEGKLFVLENKVEVLRALVITDPKGVIIRQVEKALGSAEMIDLLATGKRIKKR